jgi:hypothetical protein
VSSDLAPPPRSTVARTRERGSPGYSLSIQITRPPELGPTQESSAQGVFGLLRNTPLEYTVRGGFGRARHVTAANGPGTSSATSDAFDCLWNILGWRYPDGSRLGLLSSIMRLDGKSATSRHPPKRSHEHIFNGPGQCPSHHNLQFTVSILQFSIKSPAGSPASQRPERATGNDNVPRCRSLDLNHRGRNGRHWHVTCISFCRESPLATSNSGKNSCLPLASNKSERRMAIGRCLIRRFRPLLDDAARLPDNHSSFHGQAN